MYWSMKASGAFAAHFARIVRLRHAVLHRQVEIERRILRIRATRPPPWPAERRAKNGSFAESSGVFTAASCLLQFGIRPVRPLAADRQHGLMMYRLPNTSGCFMPMRRRAVAAHRVADQAAAHAVGNRAVVRVDVGHDIVRDELLEVAGRDRARIHRPVVDRLGVGQHHDHLLRALRERAFDGLRHVDLVRPLLRADGIAVQRIDHRDSGDFSLA